jgi:hypothetical protein
MKCMGRQCHLVESSGHSSSTSSQSKEKKRNVLNIVAQKLRSEGKYTAFGKHIARELASLCDRTAKYRKKHIRDVIFEMQMGKLNRTSHICKEISQQSWPYSHTSTPHIVEQGRHSLLLGFWTLPIVRNSINKKTQRFENWICFRPQVRGGTYSIRNLRKSLP